jgi:phosphopantetheine adenylyltransferase
MKKKAEKKTIKAKPLNKQIVEEATLLIAAMNNDHDFTNLIRGVYETADMELTAHAGADDAYFWRARISNSFTDFDAYDVDPVVAIWKLKNKITAFTEEKRKDREAKQVRRSRD